MGLRGQTDGKKTKWNLILEQNKILHTCAKINKYYSIVYAYYNK